MIIKHNIKSYSITWLSNTYDEDSSKGIIENYYVPENLDEFISLCKNFYRENKPFKIIGHTSNVYICPNTNIKNVISTRHINKWKLDGGFLYCECGTSVKRIVKSMLEDGIKGFASMIDLPGTVGAAIYGNAGVADDCISSLLYSVDILMKDGNIYTLNYDDLKFGLRSSVLKRHEIDGVIISCKLRIVKGDKEAMKIKSEYVHEWRVNNTPGPTRNLGTTALLSESELTFVGTLVLVIAWLISRIFIRREKCKYKMHIILLLMRQLELEPYLFGLNRFIWKDYNSHFFFSKYLNLINKMYKNPRLEIEVW